MSRRDPYIVIFLGTVAELIKLFPVMDRLHKSQMPFDVILSGQNDVRESDLFSYVSKARAVHDWGREPRTKSVFRLFLWFLVTFFKSLVPAAKLFLVARSKQRRYILVHGDTISTVLGALVGRLFGCVVCHVEAGLRSFRISEPFPEEIDRMIVSRVAKFHFAPGKWAAGNLGNRSGVIDTLENTLSDSLQIAQERFSRGEIQLPPLPDQFFILVVHRQENLFRRQFIESVLEAVEVKAKEVPCVFVLHKPTRAALETYGLLQRVLKNSRYILVPRLPYLQFTNILAKSQFIVTDGGSNQEESYYLNKPCLILRNVSERKEGLGQNAVLMKEDFGVLHRFLENPFLMNASHARPDRSPSDVIVDALRRDAWEAE